MYFYFTYCILQLWFLKMFPLCTSILLPSSVSIFMTIGLKFLSDKLLCFISVFFFFLEFYLLLLFGADSSVFSFCLTLCLFLWIRQNSSLSWSWEGRPCVLGRKTLYAWWFQWEAWTGVSKKVGGVSFLFSFSNFFLSCVVLIQGLSQWLR